jgi:hypothetical protein
MTGRGERERLRCELQRLTVTADALSDRLHRTLLALALSLDAQALTQQRLHEFAANDAYDGDTDLQTAAALYRHLARTLERSSWTSNGEHDRKTVLIFNQ